MSFGEMRWVLLLLAPALVAGCSGPGYGTERAVYQAAPPLKPGVRTLENVGTRPVPIHEVEPDYPPELGSVLTGKALVVFTVRTTGKVADASVLEADDVLFGEGAVNAILKWRFRPALVQGHPVDCRMTKVFIFTNPYGYYYEYGAAPPSPPDTPPDNSRPTDISPQ